LAKRGSTIIALWLLEQLSIFMTGAIIAQFRHRDRVVNSYQDVIDTRYMDDSC
jgi:hypothetical protein